MSEHSSTQKPVAVGSTASRAEVAFVALFLFAFLAINLLTAARYPFVWIDEVMYADPAANLLRGNGFVSGAWYAQSSQEFWAGNVPLPSVLLAGWMKLFGFSPTSVRSINFVYFALSCVLLWRACVKLELVKDARFRLLLLVWLAGGYSLIFSYRSGRPDCLAMLIVCALIYSFSLENQKTRAVLFVGLGIVAPWVGLQLLPLLGVGGLLLIVSLRRKVAPTVLLTWAGAAVGFGALLWFYHSHGVLEDFFRSTRQHTTIGIIKMLLGGQFRHSNLLPKDFSFMVLFVLAFALLAPQWRRREVRISSPLSFGLVFSVVMSATLVMAGKFPTYYGWMTYLPLCVCLCTTLDRMSVSARIDFGTWALAGLAVVIGTGLHFAAAAWNWRERDYAHVEKLVRENVKPSDHFLGEHATFYAAKPVVAKFYSYYYLPAMMPEEKERITVMVVAPDRFAEFTNTVGGSWVSTGASFKPARSGFLGRDINLGFLTMQDYHLEVYRRADFEN